MEKTYIEAIRETLDEEMSKDEKIVLIGEDIGFYGGAFGVTKGLFDKYGPKRVIDTPMSEQAIIGLASGAAIEGIIPIAEMMFMDFVSIGLDQIMNHAAIFNCLTSGEVNVPMVLRVPAGAGRGYGATHSKTLIAQLAHIPGIKIVYPSNPSDAKALLISSIKDKNPVIFVESKNLYAKKGEMNEEEVKIGKAKIVKLGSDLSIITFGTQVIDCLKIAEELAERSIEIIDLRSIKPLDIETIKNSVNKTGRVVIVEEGFPVCGIGSELTKRIVEECFYSLKAPIKVVSSEDCPIPCSPKLEEETMPNSKKIKQAILETING